MINKKLLFILSFSLVLSSFIFSEPFNSPTWGFCVDLPEGYEYSGGDGKDTFSFKNKDGAQFDLAVYHALGSRAYVSAEALALDVQARLSSRGDVRPFKYRQKNAVIFKLAYSSSGRFMTGWALGIELGKDVPRTAGTKNSNDSRPILLAMAYGPEDKPALNVLHFSALDSIAPQESDKLAPGPITEFDFPRNNRLKASVFGLDIDAWIFKEDAEAAQALVDREFQVLRFYEHAPNWQEAWIRFYRTIYRDSFDRLADISFQVERKMNVPPLENRELANQILKWVQSFEYERDFGGSDLINVITAATEGRGDCDSRAILWAVILKQANIPSAIMVSRNYSHAMGLADLTGTGARFEVGGKRLLVAETTAQVSIGLIGEDVSEIDQWLGILFE